MEEAVRIAVMPLNLTVILLDALLYVKYAANTKGV